MTVPADKIPSGRATARLPALWVACAALLLSACSNEQSPAAAAGAAPAATEVGFVTIRPQEVALRSEVAGRVVAFQIAEVRPQVSGLIKERVFTEGRPVKQGDVLYRLDTQSLEATVAASDATVKKTQAALASAQARFQRYQNLSGNSVISQSDRDDAEATFLQAQADVAVAMADLQAARINLGYATITAPIAGTIGTSSFDAGSLVTANQTNALATIRQLDPVYVDFTESSGNLLKFRSQIQSGAVRPLVGRNRTPEVRLVFADGTPYAEPGTIDTADQFVSETTSSFTIRSRFPNPTGILLPGMYVRGTVKIAIDDDGFLLPQRAVSRNAAGKATARFVQPDGTVATRVLAISTDIASNWLVTDGVSDGDRLIVDGYQRIQDGQAVTPVEVAIDANGLVQKPGAEAAVAKAGAQSTALGASATDAPAAAPTAGGGSTATEGADGAPVTGTAE